MIVVLVVLAICMGVAYATMRSQMTMLQVQQNSQTQSDARQVALTGLSVAIQKMHQADWAGVDSTLDADLSTLASYSVTFTTGDPAIEDSENPGEPDPAHADYQDWPFRVTVLSTGTVSNNDGATATYQVRAVMKLVPRALAAEPTGWADVNNYTVYQHTSDEFFLHPPIRIEGAMRLRGQLEFGEYYYWDDDVRDRFLNDLVRMEAVGIADQRIITGPVHLPYDLQGVSEYSLDEEDLAAKLSVQIRDVSSSQHSEVRYPGQISTYRLYSGGKEYTVTECPGTIANATIGPDPHTNPAGICYSSSSVTINDNVDFTGTLISGYRFYVTGTGLNLRAVDLPSLYGTTEPVQLMVLASGNDARFYEGCQGAITGLMTVYTDLEVFPQTSGLDMTITGRVLFQKMKGYGRWTWPQVEWHWDLLLDAFKNIEVIPVAVPEKSPEEEAFQIAAAAAPAFPEKSYFPAYLESLGFPRTPKLTIKPTAEAVQYHWPSDGEAIYVPHADDDGLMWDLLTWEDGV